MMKWIEGGLCNLRFTGDLAIALSFPILWTKLYRSGISGVSLETQILHLLVFVTRYVFDGNFFSSVYNTTFKLWYLSASAVSVALVLYMHRSQHKTLPRLPYHPFIIGPSLVLALCINYQFTGTEIAWAFSQYLAIGTMIPQLILLYKFQVYGGGADFKDADSRLIMAYVVSVEAWRAMYIPHWFMRWRTERFFDPIAQAATVTQLLVFACFLFALLVQALLQRKHADAVLPSPSTPLKDKRHRFTNSLDTIVEVPEAEALLSPAPTAATFPVDKMKIPVITVDEVA